MQDWLGQHKLDRKALAALAGNAQAVQLYQDYLHQQVSDVVEDLLAGFAEPAPAQGDHCCLLHTSADAILRSCGPSVLLQTSMVLV